MSRFHVPSNPRGWTEEGLCVGLSLLGSVAIFEVLNKPTPVASLVALLISAVVGFGAGWWIVHSRRPKRAVAVSAAVLVAVIVEAAVPTTWHHLLVDPTTWHRVASSLRVGADRTLLAACVLVSLAGASERVACGDRDRPGTVAHPALAVLPALVLVTWSAAAAPGLVSGLLCAGLIILGSLAVLVGDWPRHDTGADRDGALDRAERRRGLAVALLPPLGAFLAVVLSVSLSGALGTSRGGSINSSQESTVEALVTNVVGFASQDPKVVLFRASSKIPTYWQVAVLTRQVDGTWEVPSTLARVLEGKGVARTSGNRTESDVGVRSRMAANVTIVSYSGRLLPVPLGTAAVQGPWPTQMVGGAVVQQRPTTTGEQYSATASASATNQNGSLPPAEENTDAANGESEPVVSRNIPAAVQTMARQVVAGTDGQAAMVQQLVNWFRSGRFQYSTAAQPVSPHGSPVVVSFLTRTKVGNCQTFTDAFAMMAQSLGIPVRVAVGFTSGTRKPSGQSAVTGADAHTWPQVFVDPKSGWESVEPTPASSATAIAPTGVLGVGPRSTRTSPTLPKQSRQTPTSVASPTSRSTTPVPTSATPTVPNVSPESRPVAGVTQGVPALWLIVGAVALVGILVGVAAAVRRRRFRSRLEPPQAVVEAWRESDRSLARLGLGCPSGRTHLDHVRQLREAIVGLRWIGSESSQAERLGLEQLVSDVESLALLEREVRYGGRLVGDEEASAAWAAAGRVRRSLRYHRLGRAARGLVLARKAPGPNHSGTEPGAYASSGHGANRE
jgi:transglutaminase-like putative cysteine protease